MYINVHVINLQNKFRNKFDILYPCRTRWADLYLGFIFWKLFHVPGLRELNPGIREYSPVTGFFHVPGLRELNPGLREYSCVVHCIVF